MTNMATSCTGHRAVRVRLWLALQVLVLVQLLQPLPALRQHLLPLSQSQQSTQQRLHHRLIRTAASSPDSDSSSDGATTTPAADEEEARVQQFLAGLPPPTRLAYGDVASQYVDLYVPAVIGEGLPCRNGDDNDDNSRRMLYPTVMLLHGGFFKGKWSARNTQSTSLVPFLLERGFAVGLVEYRRRNEAIYPAAHDDAFRAMQAIAGCRHIVDPDRLIVIGHSAGGTLAIAACERAAAAAAAQDKEEENSTTSHIACLCVSIAPVPDMLSAFDERLSDEGDAIERYLGCLPDSPQNKELYARASLPDRLFTPTLLVTGSRDTDVPPALVRSYYESCRRRADTNENENNEEAAASLQHSAPVVELLDLERADHYDVVTAGATSWLRIWRHCHEMLSDHAGWAPPPVPSDYGVTSERGFLPTRDPLVSLLPLPSHSSAAVSASDDGSLEMFAAWEEAAAALPGCLAAGCVRQRLRSLPTGPTPTTVWLEHLVPAARASTAAADNTIIVDDESDEEAWLERAYLVLSFLSHAYVWGEVPLVTTLPKSLAIPWCAVADRLGRRPILTYASFNLNNWRRLEPPQDDSSVVALGNTRRCNNFLGGMDEEWFSAVHVAIESRSGAAVVAATEALRVCALTTTTYVVDTTSVAAITALLEKTARSIEDCTAILRRMGERCDPYIYNERVRIFMSGWTADGMPPEGLAYEGVPAAAPPPTPLPAQEEEATTTTRQQILRWRTECYYGETGAQSSVVPALDAALGVGFSQDELLPYLLAMRDYMPQRHADFVRALEKTRPSLRETVLSSDNEALRHSYNRCIEGLSAFRKLHFELAYTYVRQWDKRPDEEIKGTGGTPFMPYLKKHRRTTVQTLVPTTMIPKASDASHDSDTA